jgi:hypothetical protein
MGRRETLTRFGGKPAGKKDNLEHLVADGRVMLNSVISGFSRSVFQICALLGYCAAQSGNF